MKKYFLFFAVSLFFGISHASAQSRATGEKGQAAVVTEPQNSSSDKSPRGTITKAGKNQQSSYTPAADGSNTPSTGTPASQQAAPDQVQPAVIDPKKPE
ncbi:MAG: hypothetical protein JWO44_245 [Bacteroidetes bacterium]|jgi:hypothetical protein|nr:hypothetical protein [Bacteroidota bacterium]